jgi:hypothetical protein
MAWQLCLLLCYVYNFIHWLRKFYVSKLVVWTSIWAWIPGRANCCRKYCMCWQGFAGKQFSHINTVFQVMGWSNYIALNPPFMFSWDKLFLLSLVLEETGMLVIQGRRHWIQETICMLLASLLVWQKRTWKSTFPKRERYNLCFFYFQFVNHWCDPTHIEGQGVNLGFSLSMHSLCMPFLPNVS